MVRATAAYWGWLGVVVRGGGRWVAALGGGARMAEAMAAEDLVA